MSFAQKLSALLALSLIGLTHLPVEATGQTQVKVGLMPLTLYSDGITRLYYDNDSRISQISYIGPNGSQYATQEIQYDSYGTANQKLVRENRSIWSSLQSTFFYRYSKTNKVLEERQVYGFSERTLRYHYNERIGKCDTIRAFEQGFFSEYPKEKVACNYLPAGQMSARTYYDKHGLPALHEEWTYDMQGRLSEKRAYDGSCTVLAYRTTYSYDVDPGVNLETAFDGYNNVIALTYSYFDSAGNKFEADLRDANGDLVSVTKYTYNWAGQLTNIADFDSQASVIGNLALSYDAEARAYLYQFSYTDLDLLRQRVRSYLYLPGNDL